MIITGKKTLEKFAKKHADSRKQITEWIHSVEETNWQRPNDIKRQYSTVSFLADNKVIFNICGNKHRLCVLVYYSGSVVHVKWVGTHAEYSKIKFQRSEIGRQFGKVRQEKRERQAGEWILKL